MRKAAARAVGGLGAAAATDAFLARLAELLADEDSYVRRAAAWAVGASWRGGRDRRHSRAAGGTAGR